MTPRPDASDYWLAEVERARHPEANRRAGVVPSETQPYLVLICGSRDWSDSYTIWERVQRLSRKTIVIEGGARGADELARDAAIERGLFVAQVSCVDEHWKRYGKRAGHLRNGAMLSFNPALVIAFHLNGSSGTKGTIDRARTLGIPVEVYERKRGDA